MDVVLGWLGCWTALAAALLAGCSKQDATSSTGTVTSKPQPAAGPPWFEEKGPALGIEFVHTIGQPGQFYFPENVGSGGALFDFDSDGWLDLYLLQGRSLAPGATAKSGNRLYRNKGDGTFEDVTKAAGVGDTRYGMGCACGDYDNDGDIDLYVTNLGPNILYRNNADGTFTDVTAESGAGDASWGTSCLFADYDLDGHVDLFVVNYVRWRADQELVCSSRDGLRDYCSPKHYNAPARDTLLHNNGDGTFTDVTEAVGISKAFGNGLGVACEDFNNDGRLDLYVANDQMNNQLWISTGDPRAPRFSEEGLLAGCAVNQQGVAEAGMGVAVMDLGDDGDFDLFMVHLREETNTFYENINGMFVDVTANIGLAGPSLGFTGFGVGFADFDHDGLPDVYVANGRVNRASEKWDPNDPYAEPNQLIRGVAPGRFEEVMPRGGTARLLVGSSRGAAFGDIDNDGDVDVVVSNMNRRPFILMNVAPKKGNWAMFRVLNPHGSPAVGARLAIQVGQRKQWRAVQPGYGYCVSNDPRVHLGLGSATTVDKVTVRWPGGGEESFGPFAAGKVHTLKHNP
ncbi:MAG: CRTAC1 family protein [Phycisphaerae bacterium]